MTRVHDMGGRFGEGPVVPEPEGRLFHAPWHERALAVTIAAGALGQWSIDASRFAREAVRPADYMRFSYYERWMAGLAALLVDRGMVTRDELAAGRGQGTSPLADRAPGAAAMRALLARGGPTLRDGAPPRFAPGAAVRTLRPAVNRRVAGGHHRLPAYAAGAPGRVLACRGCHVLPDTSAHGLGEAPEPLYTVVFAAVELWGAAEAPGDEVTLDLWESYLEPA